MFEDIKKSAGTVMAENFSLPMTILERAVRAMAWCIQLMVTIRVLASVLAMGTMMRVTMLVDGKLTRLDTPSRPLVGLDPPR